jgi:hypothetical protein
MRTATMTVALLLFWNVVVPPEGWVDVLVGAVASLALAVWAARFLWPHAGPHHTSLHVARLPGFALLTAGASWWRRCRCCASSSTRGCRSSPP